MKKSLIATGAASLALAAMPMAGVFATDLEVTDTIQVTVDAACSIDETTTTTDGLDTKDTTYAATVANGGETTFSTIHSGNHSFHLNCNAPSGWSLSATPTNLTGYTGANYQTPNGGSINFVASGSYQNTGTAGDWTATITAPSGITVTQPSAAGSSNTVITETGHQAANVEITSAYKAYVGTETMAGYYQGTIGYTFAVL